jgi:SAM-dependent methyltransferase
MTSFDFLGPLGDRTRGATLPELTECACQVCGATAHYLDTVDFNKSCLQENGHFLPQSGTPIRYYLCGQCGFCFAPEIHAWPFKKFEEHIYNDEYVQVDPDYVDVRPSENVELVNDFFGASKAQLRHLDYGGGSGLLSKKLRETGWSSESYDPFVTPELSVADLGRFDLVTAFEVFEHVPDVARLMGDLDALCKSDGVILFTTCLSDGNIAAGSPLTWWYAAPRNGHISLFSANSLMVAFARGGFRFASFSHNLHAACRTVPAWASHMINMP